MQSILVTGGAGFIGSHTVVSLVEHGYQPIILDHLGNANMGVLDGLERILGFRPKFYQEDCCDRSALTRVFEENKIDGVIHFAAWKAVGESMHFPLKYYGNNIHSLVVLLEVMKEFKVHDLVFSSSCTVYGDPDIVPIDETAERKPYLSPYGHTKQICEDILRDTQSAGIKLRSIALRYFNPIGAHPSGLIGELPIGTPNNLVPYITQTAAGLREQLTVFGHDYDTQDGTCVRDYIHVMDIAEAHVLALLRLQKSDEEYEVFNLGTGKGFSVQEVVNTFEKVSGEKLNYLLGPRREGDVARIFASTAKSQKLLQWQAKYDLEDSLKDAWNWQQKLGKAADQ